MAERDLERLLAALDPRLSTERYSFELTGSATLAPDAFAVIREDEGLTAVRSTPTGYWAHIAIGVRQPAMVGGEEVPALGLRDVVPERLPQLRV